jgi:large subunit ribosomal protein L22
MEVKATAKFIRIAPKKARLVVDLIRGLKVAAAQTQLEFINQKSAIAILKLLKSAIANATNNFNLESSNLYIKTIVANDGPTFARWRPKAFGRANPIKKKTTNLEITLAELVASKKTAKGAKGVPNSAEDHVSSEVQDGKLLPVDEKVKTEVKSGETEEIFDVRMKGKHRSKQNLDGRSKKNKGFLKKMFNRKAV